MIPRARLLHFLLCFLLSVPALAGAADEITVSDPWIAAAPPTAKVLAAYMTIVNHTAETVHLLGAASPEFAGIALHATTMHGGMMHMTAQPDLAIAAGTPLTLAPGGYHLMLHDPKRPLDIGDRVELRLRFDHDRELTVNAEVRRR